MNTGLRWCTKLPGTQARILFGNLLQILRLENAGDITGCDFISQHYITLLYFWGTKAASYDITFSVDLLFTLVSLTDNMSVQH